MEGVDHLACHWASRHIQHLSYSAVLLHTIPSEAIQPSPVIGAYVFQAGHFLLDVTVTSAVITFPHLLLGMLVLSWLHLPCLKYQPIFSTAVTRGLLQNAGQCSFSFMVISFLCHSPSNRSWSGCCSIIPTVGMSTVNFPSSQFPSSPSNRKLLCITGDEEASTP